MLDIIRLFILLGLTSQALGQGFSPAVTVVDPNTLLIKFQIPHGAYLYKDKLLLNPIDRGIAHLGPLKLPLGKTKIDPILGTYEIYTQKLSLPIALLGLEPGEAQFELRYQGCTDAGYCYPPEEQLLTVTIDPQLAVTEAWLRELKPPQLDSIGQLLAETQTFWAGLLFLGFGLLLAFTPCILPMVPILSGIIVGHGDDLTPGRGLKLSCVYVLAMASTYAVVGMGVAYLGENLQTALQYPWVQWSFAGVFVLLALSMFGVLSLSLPTRLQTALANLHHRAPQGTYFGTAIMGLLSVLILSPCVTPPLVGALGYIATTGDIFLGALALFMLGLGMGLPLILFGAALGKYLPKAGYWMQWVKYTMGIILLGMAAYLISPTWTARTGVTTLADLNQLLSQSTGQRVLLTYSAEWCVNCKIMDKRVLVHPDLKTCLNKYKIIKVDVTDNDRAARMMLSKFNVIAPPTYVFLDAHGLEIKSARIVGLIGVEEFLERCRLDPNQTNSKEESLMAS